MTKKLPLLSSPHSRQQNPAKKYCQKNLSSPENSPEDSHWNNEAKKWRKTTNLQISVWVAQVGVWQTNNSNELSSTLRTKPDQYPLERKPLLLEKSPKRGLLEQCESSTRPISHTPSSRSLPPQVNTPPPIDRPCLQLQSQIKPYRW